MRRNVSGTLVGVVGAFLLSTSALAHHGAASLYELKKEMTVKGTVTEFRWANPHVELGVAPADAKGTPWLLELGSPPNIGVRGWTSKTVKPGDTITVTFNPSSQGLRTGLFLKAVLADGKEMVK
jgi:hypothetical protein